ncbi:MAG: DNA methylase, partial [Chloroflexia bacterium]|nr:DNA methylase [Chloroflexia bacterium]
MTTTGRATQATYIDSAQSSRNGHREGDAAAVEALRERLADPGFRAAGGCSQGTTEAILAMSAPPDYTACPNPFIAAWVERHGRPYDPAENYQREPFAVDVSVGKTDALYRAHGYHTKVPHLAIVPSILHYTEPGDIVLDGFCGSGMTGVAAQWCGAAPDSYRRQLEAEWERDGRDTPQWGARRAILNDLSPAATLIAANYNRPFDIQEFAAAARTLLDEIEAELGWMYETTHTDGRLGRIEYTVWSEVFICPSCTGEVVFTDAALDLQTFRVADSLTCPHCGAQSTKERMDLAFESFLDIATGEVATRPRRVPVLINYKVGKDRFTKRSDSRDAAILERIAADPLPTELPTHSLPDCQMARVGRMRTTNTSAVHFMFLPRA